MRLSLSRPHIAREPGHVIGAYRWLKRSGTFGDGVPCLLPRVPRTVIFVLAVPSRELPPIINLGGGPAVLLSKSPAGLKDAGSRAVAAAKTVNRFSP